MIYHDETQLEHICINYVGNPTQQESLVTSETETFLEEDMKELLKDYFLKSFKPEILFEFFNQNSLDQNEVYNLVNDIFEQPNLLEKQSKQLAKLLFDVSENPRTKGGEFYVCYFTECVLKGERFDAIGLFKSENKDTFLKVSPNDDTFKLETSKGINLNKLDKGAVIFNSKKEEGYIISVIDGTSRAETSYWMDDFLQLKQKQDDYFDTQETMTVYKDYITKQLPQEFEINKVDQAEFLNNSINFFKEKKQFDLEEFSKEVLKDNEVIESFNNFKTEYEQEMQVSISEDFAINNAAVKKQNSSYKSIIKLDKNFHIYIHGDRKMIQQGSDENGKFYQLYFEEEK